MSHIFKFREFDLTQGPKVFPLGTDTMLLGAWVQPGEVKTILDIGTGTGALALMMAQKSDAIIEAIDINREAVNLAQQNIKTSKWTRRIKITQISFQEFTKQAKEQFDLLITNPPYFENSLKPQEIHMITARHNDLLSLKELLQCGSQLLSQGGRLCLVLPLNEADQLMKIAQQHSLHLIKAAHVKPTAAKPANRILLELSNNKKEFEENVIVVRDEKGKHTEQYIEITKDFHLPGAV